MSMVNIDKSKGVIIVSGGAGYIGSHICSDLIEHGYTPVIVDNFCNSERAYLANIDTAAKQHIRCIEVDMRDGDKLLKELAELHANSPILAAIHCAGLKAVGESWEQATHYYDNNIVSTISLLKAMNALSIKHLVFSSSATVYGDQSVQPIAETASLQALNPYGRTKLMIEEIIEDWAVSETKTGRAINLRYFNPGGAHPSLEIGENTKAPNNIIPILMQAAFGERDKVSIFGNDYPTADGSGVRDYIHICDLAAGHRLALEYLWQQNDACCEAINLGTSHGNSVIELLKHLQDIHGQAIDYAFVARREGDIATAVADFSKAKKLLGWQAKRDIRSLLQSAYDYKKKLGAK